MSEVKVVGIYAKLFELRRRCGSILKEAEANIKGHYKYNYARLDHNVKKILPHVEELNLFYHWSCQGNTLKIKVVDLDSSDVLESHLNLSEENLKDGSFQEIGKELTYFSNRLLLLILGLVAEEEDDAEINDVPQRRTKTAKKRRPPAVQEDDEDADEYEDEDDEDEDEDDQEPTPRRSNRRMQRRGLPRRGR